MTSRTDTAWVHWAENLDVANGIKAEASGNARLYEGDDAACLMFPLSICED
jgi:hypothetical protein